MKYRYTAIAATVLFAQAATAQNNQAKGPIEEVFVEGIYLSVNEALAVRTPTAIINVPQSLSIITADQIDEQGLTSIADLVNYTVGVNNTQGEGHRDAVVFRGVRSTADFYIDGVRDDVQYYRPLYNLEQVEILRGPNALLFGRGGTGGILNRVTEKGAVGESFNNFQVSAGTFGDFGIEIDSNIDTGDRSAVRINAFYEGLENHRDFFDGDRVGFNPTARFEVSDVTTLDLSYEYVDHERFIDRGIPTNESGDPVEALDDVVFGDAEDNLTTIQANILRAALEHKISDSLKANVSIFYGDYDKTYQNYFASDFISADVNGLGFDQVEIDGYVDNTERENLILSGSLVGEFDFGSMTHTIVSGVEYIETSSDQDRLNTVWDVNGDDQLLVDLVDGSFNLRSGVIRNASGAVLATNTGFGINGLGDGFGANVSSIPGTDLNDRTLVEIETVSFFVQDEIGLTEQINLVLGARFDSFDISVDNLDPTSSSAGLRNRRDEELSPRAGIIYKPQDNVSIYASYSESFLPRSGEQFANINGDNNDLDPDEFENTELGVKWDFANLSLTAAYFENDQTRADRTDIDDGTFTVRGLEVDGFEIQLLGDITEKIHFTAGYSNLDGTTLDGGVVAQPRELPENTFAAWAGYDVNESFGFGLGVSYQDESFTSDTTAAELDGAGTLPSYTKVDASAYYNISDTFRLQLNVENVTDEDYFPSSHTDNNVTVGESVNAKLTLSGSF